MPLRFYSEISGGCEDPAAPPMAVSATDRISVA